MELDDLEMALRNAKFQHLTEDELDSYIDRTLDEISQARAEAHLNLCLICERRLALLKEESAAVCDQEVTAEDVALVRRIMRQMKSQENSSDANRAQAVTSPLLSDRLAGYLRQAMASWQAHFRKKVTARGIVDSGKVIWRWQSEDGIFKAHAILEENADLTIHFSSTDTDLEYARFKIRMGSLSREATFQRVSESEVYARVDMPRQERPEDMTNISIERA